LFLFHIEIDGARTADLHAFPTPGAGFGIDDETVRDGLRIREIDRLSFLKPSTKLPLHFHRTDLDTSLTKSTTFRINETRFSNDGNPKIASLSFDLYHFRMGQQFNVVMKMIFVIGQAGGVDS
jgi:hypothetical protein